MVEGIGGVIQSVMGEALMQFVGPSAATNVFEVEYFALETLLKILKDSSWRQNHILVLIDNELLVNQTDIAALQDRLWNCKILTVQLKHINREWNGVADANARRGAFLKRLEITGVRS